MPVPADYPGITERVIVGPARVQEDFLIADLATMAEDELAFFRGRSQALLT